MKDRLINVIKWFFITLGVLFSIQLLIAFGMIIGFTNFQKRDVNIIGNTQNKLKDIQPLINSIEDYYQKNNKYPQNIENVKVKKGLDYKYEPSKDNNCYTITIKSKKNNLTKQYQHCAIKSENSSSSSESYIEFEDTEKP